MAQGLIPLGEASSDDEEGPCELPDGRLVCGPHGLVVCYKCCSDYNFDLSDDSGDDDLPKYESRADDDNVPKHENRSGDASTEEANATREGIPGIHPLHPYFIAADSGVPHGLPDEPKRRGTGRVFPTKFDAPPSAQVHELFETKLKYVSMTRYVYLSIEAISYSLTICPDPFAAPTPAKFSYTPMAPVSTTASRMPPLAGPLCTAPR